MDRKQNRFGLVFAILAFLCLETVYAAEVQKTEGARAGGAITKAGRLILLDVASAGKRLVAVGERGVVFTSDDEGKTWAGVRTPTTRTLTAVAFEDKQTGVAVGHGGSILRTEDGGLNWQVVSVSDIGEDSVLGINRIEPGHLVAYGAFGLFIESTDSGKTWKRHSVVGDDFDRHITSVFRGPDRLIMLGESGTIAISTDGSTWRQVVSPYEGSWFGGLSTRSGAVLIFGMRGNVFRSVDNGETWTKVALGSTQGVMGAVELDGGSIVLVGNAGLVAKSDDQGRTFRLLGNDRSRSYAQAVSHTSGQVIAVGDHGITPLNINN